ncbi:hypothetical protein [Burkholderia contaminans]|uniref:Uncharacterized protein n=1 Tax=Burkholderia contaminans TaxID=488447 RepID=A0AAP1V7R6_9BURK|nr:hypothetical protein [Burkholderia contaminans]MBK1902049.1 hypothetical protein [Burkholderia contaminans]MBK1910332.1 hypothetical protein [Burkholderia contaminans]MBK1923791.1 hypothetical protein [Burkholderia contaminans]MBK1932003.1 hypothetical protein [Burkholderia contaminans]MBK1939252.1 hypothetical protein [Burkholderia contaminans]
MAQTTPHDQTGVAAMPAQHRESIQKAAEVLSIFTGQDSYSNLRHKYGNDWWEPVNKIEADLRAILTGSRVAPQVTEVADGGAAIARAREAAFMEAASVDAKVLALLMSSGKVSRQDVNQALAAVAAIHNDEASTPAHVPAVANAMTRIHQVWVEATTSWRDVDPTYYTERLPSNRRIVYAFPGKTRAPEAVIWKTTHRAVCVPITEDREIARQWRAAGYSVIKYTAQSTLEALALPATTKAQSATSNVSAHCRRTFVAMNARASWCPLQRIGGHHARGQQTEGAPGSRV